MKLTMRRSASHASGELSVTNSRGGQWLSMERKVTTMMGTDGGALSPPVPAPEEIVPLLYRVYCSDVRRSQLEQTEWVIKGTDGQMYIVSSEPGG